MIAMPKKKYNFYWEQPKEELKTKNNTEFKVVLPFPKSEIPISMAKNDKEIILRAELPGFKKHEIFLNIKGNMISIKAEKKKGKVEKGKSYFIKEASSEIINRTFALPEKIDEKKSEAKLEDGILEIRMPISWKRKTKKFIDR